MSTNRRIHVATVSYKLVEPETISHSVKDFPFNIQQLVRSERLEVAMALTERLLIVFLIICASQQTSQLPNRKVKRDTLVSSTSNNDLGAMDIITNINQVNDLTDLFEGDINVVKEKKAAPIAEGSLSDEFKRYAMRDRRYLWHSGVVPYEVASDLTNFIYTIKEALQEISSKSCIKFVERTNEDNWIKFVRRAGCWSSVGKLYWRPGLQEISLGDGCLLHETIVHEVLHALGFWHQQSRPDRDQFIEIFWENIEEGQESNFKRYSHQEADVLGVQYDYSSVMHYGSKAFSKNGKVTMKPIRETSVTLGVASGLSELDAIQLNALYDCQNSRVLGWSQWSGYSPCDGECFKYRQRFCKHSNATLCEGTNEHGVQTEKAECKKDETECYAPINGNWGQWGSWSACSKSCDLGLQQRSRECNDPAPKYNGLSCEGEPMSSQECKLKSCNLGPNDCEFDSENFCDWTNDASNSEAYTWKRISGSTPSKYTGPTNDHTSQSGHYIYLEASSPATQGCKGKLISQVFTNRDEKCLMFYYHMYGTEIGSLKVFFEGASTNTQVLLWEQNSNHGNEWNRGAVSLRPEEDFKIIFEGERGIGFRGDIALDDVYFKSGPCSTKVNKTSSVDEQSLVIPTKQPTAYVKEIGCFKDLGYIGGKRPFPQFISYRNQIDWSDMTKTVTECALMSKKLNFKHFAVEFYGECWFGPEDEINYTRDGMTTDCWNGVGRSRTMMVYKWST